MDLKELSPKTRRIVLTVWTAFFGTLYFIAIPVALATLNEARGWPVLEVPWGGVVGPLLTGAGICLVAYCNYLFARIGRGSIVPIDATRKLVVAGPYRYSRNPVFVGYLVVLAGIFVASGAASLLAYGVVFFLYLEFFIREEEPGLLQRFGEEYRSYVRAVPRWLGRRRAD